MIPSFGKVSKAQIRSRNLLSKRELIIGGPGMDAGDREFVEPSAHSVGKKPTIMTGKSVALKSSRDEVQQIQQVADVNSGHFGGVPKEVLLEVQRRFIGKRDAVASGNPVPQQGASS